MSAIQFLARFFLNFSPEDARIAISGIVNWRKPEKNHPQILFFWIFDDIVIRMKDLLKKLIQTAPNETNGESGAAHVLETFFQELGIDCQVDIWDQNRANFTVCVKSQQQKPGLLFGAHLDVVPADSVKWTMPCHEGTELDGRIYGRGSVDMLGGLVAVCGAIADIIHSGRKLKGDLILTATAGEETDSCGVKRFTEQNQEQFGPLAGIILPEPTNLEILTAHRGILWLQIETHGKSAHGSMPHLGINAIEKMTAVLNRLKEFKIPHTLHPDLGGCSISLNQIHGGTGTNIVPDSCRIELDIRTIPGQNKDQILRDLQQILDDEKSKDPEFNAKISIPRSVNPLQTDSQSPFVQQLLDATGIHKTSVAPFTTDGPHFLPLSENVIIFGPGKPALCHKPDERIEIAELEEGKQMFLKIIHKFL